MDTSRKGHPTLLPAPSFRSLSKMSESARPCLEQSKSRASRVSPFQLSWLQDDGIADKRVLVSCSGLVLNTNGIQFQMCFQPQNLSAHDVLGLAAKVGKDPGDMIQSLNGRGALEDFNHEMRYALRSRNSLVVCWKDETMSFEEIFEREAGWLVLDYLLLLTRISFLILFCLCSCGLLFFL